MTKKRGIKYLSYNGTDYCPKCGMWGIHEIWQSYLTIIYNVGSVKHTERIEGYEFTIKRCWYLIIMGGIMTLIVMVVQ